MWRSWLARRVWDAEALGSSPSTPTNHMQKTSYDIDRDAAAKLLNVTTRTIDRYIRSGRLSARHANGRIFLSNRELKHLKTGIFINNPAPRMALHAEPREDADLYRNLYEQSVRLLERKDSNSEQNDEYINEIEILKAQYRKEKTNRLIVTAILYVLLLLQPVLWYFLRQL